MKIALFDFCETLVNFQTANAFVDFVIANGGVRKKYLKILFDIFSRCKIFAVIRRLWPKLNFEKKAKLFQLKGVSQHELLKYAHDYYCNSIKSNLIEPLIEELIKKQSEGYHIYIVSGGYDIYLNEFASEYGIENVLSGKLLFENGIFTGRLCGKDCMFEYKLEYINETIPDKEYETWIAYSDSETDLSMLELVGTPIVISHGKSQEWAQKRNFKQIIWN